MLVSALSIVVGGTKYKEGCLMTKEVVLYIVGGCVVWGLIGVSVLRRSQWWLERKCRKSQYWKKYFQDIEIFRILVDRNGGYATGWYAWFTNNEFDPQKIIDCIQTYCDTSYTPDIFLNLWVLWKGIPFGEMFPDYLRNEAAKNLKATGKKEFVFYGYKYIPFDE